MAGPPCRAGDGELVPMFPNAAHYIQAAEYEYAAGPMREAWKFETYIGPAEVSARDASLMHLLCISYASYA